MSSTTYAHPFPTTVPLSGRVALVTGAGSGIGAATAVALARAGAAVGLVGRRTDRLEEVRSSIASAGGRAAAAPADVTDAQSLTAAVATLQSELGPVDIVVANAGVMYPQDFAALAPGEWDRQLDVNVRGLMSTIHTALPDLTREGREGVADVVVVSSIAATVAFPSFSVYNASKAAASWLGESLRPELAARGVRVTVVEPGLTDTELQGKVGHPQAVAELEEFAKAVGAIAAEDVAELIAFAVTRPPGVAVPRLRVQPVRQP